VGIWEKYEWKMSVWGGIGREIQSIKGETVQNRPDGSGMAGSLCGFCCLCSFCGCISTPLDEQSLAIRTDSGTRLCDER